MRNTLRHKDGKTGDALVRRPGIDSQLWRQAEADSLIPRALNRIGAVRVSAAEFQFVRAAQLNTFRSNKHASCFVLKSGKQAKLGIANRRYY